MKNKTNLLVNITNIPILIKGKDFLNTLSPMEANLIRPFIKTQGQAQRKKPFLVNIKELDGLKPIKTPEISLKFKKILESNFTQNKITFELAFRDFVKNLYPCIVNLEGLFEDGKYRIIINKGHILIFNTKSSSLDIYYRKNKSPSLINFLRLLLKVILDSKKDGIMLHASSVEYEDSGYVFIGHSGSGKSTIARMLGKEKILSDDITVIKRENDSYKIFPNPWWNPGEDIDISEPYKPAHLKVLFFITKSKKTSLRRLSYKETIGKLIYGDRGFHQYGLFDNKSNSKNFYLFCYNLISSVPVFELNVNKGRGFKKEFNCICPF